jgi:ABC-type sugar transport system ATPase subunit
VSFGIQRGECHALLGENGAGKSTLGKILAGIYRPDAGHFMIDGEVARFNSPRDAAQAGVAIVHQELVFCPNLTVAENLCLHDLPRRRWRLDRAAMRQRAEAMLREIGLVLDVDRRIDSLSVAQEQMVQIAAAVGWGARILVFDEPTSSLGTRETEKLFELIGRLRERGVTIVYVSHRLEEIFRLCQRVTVLRDGCHVATRAIGEVDRDQIVQMMVGRAVEVAVEPPPLSPDAPVRLDVRRLSSPGRFQEVDLQVRAGEIVGLAGLVGAGRSELAQALFGLDPQARGEVRIDGRVAVLRSPRAAQAAGIALVPEDRKRQGLVLSMNVRENLTLPVLERFRAWLGRIGARAERAEAEQARERLSIRAPDVETATSALSGGNQQKILFGKALLGESEILLIDEPTRGVDVGGKQEIHELIVRLAGRGGAIVLISSELPELLSLSHRVVVLREGRIVAECRRDQADPQRVLRQMAGIAQA